MGSSIVEYFGENQAGHCGYCNSDGPDKFNHGMWAHSLTVRDYQDLIDRGWRRSGKYCYKPVMHLTCCPQYTIRCDVDEFKLSKSHKKVLKKMHRFLVTGEMPGGKGSPEAEPAASTSTAAAASPETALKLPSKAVNTPVPSGADPDKPKCQKAKEIRKQKKLAKLEAKGEDLSEYLRGREPVRKTLEDFLSEPLPANAAHSLELRLIRVSPPSPEFQDSLELSHGVYWRYQCGVHGDLPSKPNLRQFQRFLCTSPLIKEDAEGEHPGYGSFHQHYLLDGKLIAIGVLDVLPDCVSSKYFFYDPDYQFLVLGTYSALREIVLVRSLKSLTPSLKYYYMGFYVHSCQKMKYKAQFAGSCLLCPESLKWQPVEKCLPKLDGNKYSRLDPGNAVDEDKEVVLDSTMVLFERTAMPFIIYRRLKEKKGEAVDSDSVHEYVSLVGHNCAQRILLFRE